MHKGQLPVCMGVVGVAQAYANQPMTQPTNCTKGQVVQGTTFELRCTIE